MENSVNTRKSPLWLLALVVTMPTFFAFLATSATNVALLHISGAFGSTSDEAKWVVTSYMIANGVFLPLTGWLEKTLGRLNFLKIFILLFTIGSIICSLAPSLSVLILGRIVQGVGGGVLMPMSQSILLQEFPPERKGDAMSIFILATMVSSIMGPAVGGLLVDNLSWQWMFIINIPVGILSLIFIPMVVNDTAKRTGENSVDFVGIIFLILWLFSMQVILDKGQQYGWFDCTWIRWTSLFSLACMLFFIVWELEYKKPIVDLRVFKNINFFAGTVLGSVVNIMVFSTVILLPQFYQGLMGYTASATGLAIGSRVFACVSLLFIGKLCELYNPKLLISLGFLLLGISTAMCVNLNMEVSPGVIIVPNVLFGLGSVLALVPISAIALGSLPKDLTPSAAGIHSLSKCVMGSVGTSLASSFTIGIAQIHQNYLIKNMTVHNPVFLKHFSHLQNFFLSHGDIITAAKKANTTLYHQLLGQAKLCAISDLFLAITTIAFLAIFLVFILQDSKKNSVS